MPSRVLLSTEAAVSQSFIPLATKKRRKVPIDQSHILPNREDGPDADAEAEPLVKKKKQPRPKVYSCTFPNCDKAFSRPCRLQEHVNAHNGDRPHVCSSCGKSFYRSTHLRAHQIAQHEDARPHSCPVEGCVKAFNTMQHLKRHIASHSVKLPHQCALYPPCIEGFRKKTQLERHVRQIHLGLKPFSCKRTHEDGNICNESFDTKGKLEVHINRDHKGGGGNKYFCEECFAEEPGGQGDAGEGIEIDGMTRGTIVVWPEDEEPTKSDKGQSVGSEEDESHQSDEEPHFPTTPTSTAAVSTAATSSKLGFKTYSALQTHIRTAHPPICRTCGKRCASNRDLRVHITENHSLPLPERRRPHTCPYSECNGKGFSRKWGLTVHIRTIHEKERNHICPVEGCGKGFGARQTMELHYERHFKNDKAGKSVGEDTSETKEENRNIEDRRKRKEALASLLTRLTGVGYSIGRSISCVAIGCEYRFKRRYDLEVHLQAMHGISKQQADEILGRVEGDVDGEGVDGECVTQEEDDWSD